MIPRDMASGECRWVGRQDIHVYCRAPPVEGVSPVTGRSGWMPGPVSYCVVCPDAGLEYGSWVGVSEASRLVAMAMKSKSPWAA